MAWFENHYHCSDCGAEWEDEWSCCCDDECPNCGSGDWSPVESDDLTISIEKAEGCFVVLRSPERASDRPDYEEVGSFLSRHAAMLFVETYF